MYYFQFLTVQSWGYPELLCKCPNTDWPILNPTIEKTYEVIEAVFAYAKSVMRDYYMHVGGDEIDMSCWKQDPSVKQFMDKMGYTSYDQVLAYFEKRIVSLAAKYNISVNCWEELLLDYDQQYIQLPKSTVVTAWTGLDKLPRIVKQGYPSLLSAGWYLDQQRPNAKVVHFSKTLIQFIGVVCLARHLDDVL
jgi:hexosaminidase